MGRFAQSSLFVRHLGRLGASLGIFGNERTSGSRTIKSESIVSVSKSVSALGGFLIGPGLFERKKCMYRLSNKRELDRGIFIRKNAASRKLVGK